jgi:hypothetical protein
MARLPPKPKRIAMRMTIEKPINIRCIRFGSQLVSSGVEILVPTSFKKYRVSAISGMSTAVARIPNLDFESVRETGIRPVHTQTCPVKRDNDNGHDRKVNCKLWIKFHDNPRIAELIPTLRTVININ